MNIQAVRETCVYAYMGTVLGVVVVIGRIPMLNAFGSAYA